MPSGFRGTQKSPTGKFGNGLQAMENLEIEVKFYLSDVNPIRSRIIELGADPKGRVFETNLRFEDADVR